MSLRVLVIDKLQTGYRGQKIVLEMISSIVPYLRVPSNDRKIGKSIDWFLQEKSNVGFQPKRKPISSETRPSRIMYNVKDTATGREYESFRYLSFLDICRLDICRLDYVLKRRVYNAYTSDELLFQRYEK